MVSALIPLALLAAATSMQALRAEMRVGSDVKPMKDVRVVYPDTPEGPRDKIFFATQGGAKDVPSLFFGGGYAVGRIPNGFAVKTRIGGDRIVATPIPATLQGKNLSLNFGVCRIVPPRPRTGPDARQTPMPRINVSIVQWTIHDVPWADYQINFKATNLGECPPSLVQKPAPIRHRPATRS